MHQIRLRGPWQKQIEPAQPSQRVRIPESPQDSVNAVVCYRRKFNSPTGLQPAFRVFLVATGFRGRVSDVMLNAETLPIEIVGEQHLRCELTGRLQSHNELQLRIEPSEGEEVALCGEVTIEIDNGEAD